MKYDIYDISILNISSYRALMRVGEGQEAPIQIWGKMEEEERGHMEKYEQPHQFDLAWVYR